MPESADAYAVNLSDDAKAALGLTDDDPMVTALRERAHAAGKPQGWMDAVMEGAAALAEAGLLDGGIDPDAEAAALGERAPERRREAEVFAESLKGRDGFDDDMHRELLSLTPTAAGVRLIEYLRKNMTTQTGNPNPGGGAADPLDAAKAEAKALAADPRYGKDRAFTADADRKWAAAHGARA